MIKLASNRAVNYGYCKEPIYLRGEIRHYTNIVFLNIFLRVQLVWEPLQWIDGYCNRKLLAYFTNRQITTKPFHGPLEINRTLLGNFECAIRHLLMQINPYKFSLLKIWPLNITTIYLPKSYTDLCCLTLNWNVC